MQQGPRVAVIGLDCATPQLLFRDLHGEVPNIAKLMGEGVRRPRRRSHRRSRSLPGPAP